MTNKRVLFVGDLRSAYNYGAILTSECLMELTINSITNNENIRFIDARSFYGATPKEGWVQTSHSKQSIKVLKSNISILFPFITKVYKLLKKEGFKKHHVPSKFEEYDSYAEQVFAGKHLAFEFESIKWADTVYINSEGNIVNGTDKYGRYRVGGLYVLFIAFFAKKYCNKEVCIVNHTVDPGNRDILDIIKTVYPMLDYVYVRENLSLRKLQDLGITNVKFVPDALFTYIPKDESILRPHLRKQIDFSKPYICIGDSSAIKSKYSGVKWDVEAFFTSLINELKKIIPQVVFVDGFSAQNEFINRAVKRTGISRISLHNCTQHELYYVLKSSSLFISGRWHASILAILGGTPILLWGADSHKTLSLYDLLDYPFRFFEILALPISIPEIINEAKKVLADSDQVIYRIKVKVDQLKKIAHNNTNMFR